MRIGELSRRTGVAVPTIKYYVREGLLPPGELSSPNQARYGEQHEQRLRLIRALITVGKLPVASVREILGALSSPDRPLHRVLGVAQKSVTAGRMDITAPEEERERARRRVARLVAERGWQVSLDKPAALSLIDTLAVMAHLGHEGFPERLEQHAEASERIAEADLASLADDESPEEMAETVIVGTMLGDTALAALRRLAQQNLSAVRFGGAGVASGARPPSAEAPAAEASTAGASTADTGAAPEAAAHDRLSGA